MKKLQILTLALFLFVPALAIDAQTAAANKNWGAFWKQFTSAVNRKSKPAVKRLMMPENHFFPGGGSESRDEWLALVDKQKWWGLLQKSVKVGVKTYDYDGKPSRVTRDNHLIFVFIGKRWRFVGPMGV